MDIRDNLGNEIPADELNRLPRGAGPLDFGFPYCHQGDIADPQFGHLGSCTNAVPPAAKLGPHAAALGLRFYNGRMFPERYRQQLFIAQRGSWNRTPPQAPKVSLIRMDATGRTIVAQEDFLTGFQTANGARRGRPVDVEVLPDGSLLVSDSEANKIYRVTYGLP